MKKCKICTRNQNGDYQNYGGECCRECSSFFTRTICANIQYECSNFYLCLDNPSLQGSQCRGCRFSKCLEIGMNCIQLNTYTNYKPIKNGVCHKYSKIIHNFFQICLEKPEFFYDLIKKDDPNLIEKSRIKLNNLDQIYPERVLNWAMILQNNKFNSCEFQILFFLIIYSINLSWIPPFQQEYIKECQNQAIDKKAHHFKIPENRKETLKKLTEFFSNKFETLYCSTMK